MDDANQLREHERSIGQIEGKLESLATKEYVKQVQIEIANKIDEQTEKIREAIKSESSQLGEDIKGVRDKQIKIVGGIAGAGFVLSLVLAIGGFALQIHRLGITTLSS